MQLNALAERMQGIAGWFDGRQGCGGEGGESRVTPLSRLAEWAEGQSDVSSWLSLYLSLYRK